MDVVEVGDPGGRWARICWGWGGHGESGGSGNHGHVKVYGSLEVPRLVQA